MKFNICKNEKNLSGIYKIKNCLNNRFYIGSTICFLKRFKEHKNLLDSNKHYNHFLQNDYNKSGKEYFIFEAFELFSGTILELTSLEQKHIDIYYDNKINCYNIAKHTKRQKSECFSKTPLETKLKKSLTMKKIWENKEYKENFINLLKKHHNNPETKKKTIEHFKNLWKNPEHRKHIIEKQKQYWSNPKNREKASIIGINANFRHSEETKKYLSEINKNKVIDKKTKRKISKSLILYFKNNPKIKEKMKNNSLNLWSNKEYKEKMITKIKNRCNKPVKSINLTNKEEICFESVRDAAKYFNISDSNIRDVLKGRIKSTKNNTLFFIFL